MGQLVNHLIYVLFKALWWKLPRQTLINGRRPLIDDLDLRKLIVAVRERAYMKIFVEHHVDLPEVLEEPNMVQNHETKDINIDREFIKVGGGKRVKTIVSEEVNKDVYGRGKFDIRIYDKVNSDISEGRVDISVSEEGDKGVGQKVDKDVDKGIHDVMVEIIVDYKGGLEGDDELEGILKWIRQV